MHAVFNPIVVTIINLILVTTYGYIADGDWLFAIANGSVSALISLRITTVCQSLTGHGVGIIKKGKYSLLGLPILGILFFLIVFSLIISVIFIYYIYFTSEYYRIFILGISLLFSYVLSLLSWRFHIYYETWYGSEYEARMEFKKKGYDFDLIEEKIRLLKKKGVIL